MWLVANANTPVRAAVGDNPYLTSVTIKTGECTIMTYLLRPPLQPTGAELLEY